MTAMLWQGTELLAKYEFEENKNDLENLARYLEDSKNIPSSIIIDVLEEEVTLTNIPHVAPHERKFLIERATTRMRRGTDFSTANIIGREKSGRRDDRLLVSGLTSESSLLKWLDIINKYDLIIKGVYSLPLITDNILKVLKVRKGLTLLVSRQSRDFIRQSIFKDGKLFYSRNIPSSQKFDIDIFSSDLKKTRKYLENQKFLDVNDRIDVLVLTSNKFFKQLSGLDELLPDMDISYVQHDDLKSSLRIKSEYNIGGREIFSSLLLGSMTRNHYGRKEDLEKYRNKLFNNWLNFGSVAAAIIMLLLSSKLYIDINVIDERVKGVDEQIKALRGKNNLLQKDLSKLPVKAKKMKLFMDNVAELKVSQQNSIEKSMVKISQVFNAYSIVSIEKLSWSVSGMAHKSSSRKKTNRKRRAVATKKSSSAQVLEVTASIDFSTLNKQKAMQTVDRFINSLSKVDAVKSVQVTKQPIKSAAKDKINGVMSDGIKNMADFSFTIFMEKEKDAG